MLQSVKQLNNLILAADDGEIGRSKDFLIDDRAWVVRYLVADTGTWLPGRKILLLPASLGKPERASRHLTVKLTKQQIENAPGLDSDAPVSRQYEAEYHAFFGMPYYWDDPAYSAEIIDPESAIAEGEGTSMTTPGSAESHLRSTDELIGYGIRTTDDVLGQVEDFILDDETWYIRYLVVATGNWQPEKKFLVTPALLGPINYKRGTVTVHMTKEQLLKSPEDDLSPTSSE